MVRVLWKFVVIGLLFGVSWFLIFICALMENKKISEINEVDKIEVIGSYIGRAVIFIGTAVCIGAFISYVGYNKKFANTEFLLLTIALNMLLVRVVIWNTCGLLTEEIRLKWLGCIHTEKICKKMRDLSEKLIFFLIGFAIFDILWSLYDIDKNKKTIYSANLTLLCLVISENWSYFCRKKKKWLQILNYILTITLIPIIGLLIFLMFYTSGKY